MKSFVSATFVLGLAALVSGQSTGTPTATSLPYNVESPGATPSYVPRPLADLLPVDQVAFLAGAVTYRADSALAKAVYNLQHKRDEIPAAHKKKRGLGAILFPTPTSAAAAAATSKAQTCIDGTNNIKQINTLLSAGGNGLTVYLCPSAKINVDQPIQFTATNQTIATKGLPTGDTRALLTITTATLSNVITGSCDFCSGVAIRNIQINGNRPALGWIQYGGSALIEMGGTNSGGIIDNVKAYEPRSWSTVHAIEGQKNACRGMQITNNQLGPAGQPPSGSSSQTKRDTPAGQWADGISMACAGSTVTGNTVTDATDGGIVIFGAPNSTVSGNTIVTATRQLMGGINMVDYNPWAGDYTGTVVSGNTFSTTGPFMKIGVAIGAQSWGSGNKSTAFTSFGTVSGNTFQSSGSGYFGYGITVAGAFNTTVGTGNVFHFANFGGINTKQCLGAGANGVMAPPTKGPFYYDAQTTSGLTIPTSFVNHVLAFLICIGPGAIVQSGYTTFM